MSDQSAVTSTNLSGPDKLQLQPQVTLRTTNTGLVMLFDRARGVMYELNETATAAVERLSESEHTFDGLVAALTEEFDAPASEIEEDVRQFISEFAEANLVAIEPAGA